MPLAAAVLLASRLLAPQDAAAPHEYSGAPSVSGSAEMEVASLAVNIDNAIKVCSEESARAAAGRSEIGKIEKRAVDAGLLKWIGNPSAPLVAQAKGRPARFGQWFDPHATIWMIAYDSYPSCRILVAGSPWTMHVRPALYAKIQDDNFWTLGEAEQPFDQGLVRASFHAQLPPTVNIRPQLSVVAPVSPSGGAIQLSVGVHMVSKEIK